MSVKTGNRFWGGGNEVHVKWAWANFGGHGKDQGEVKAAVISMTALIFTNDMKVDENVLD